MTAGELDIMALPPMKDFSGYNGPLDHPIVVPLPSKIRAEVCVSHDFSVVEINGVYRDGTYAASCWTGLCPELEAQFKFLAQLLKDEFKEKCLVPVRVGRDKAEIREMERVVPPVEGHIFFEAYLYDCGSIGSVETQKELARCKNENDVDDGGIVAAAIVCAWGYGEITPVDRTVVDVVRVFERRQQIRKLIELMDEEGNLLSLADGGIKHTDTLKYVASYFEEGFPNVAIINTGRPFNTDDTAQQYYYSPETYDL